MKINRFYFLLISNRLNLVTLFNDSENRNPGNKYIVFRLRGRSRNLMMGLVSVAGTWFRYVKIRWHLIYRVLTRPLKYRSRTSVLTLKQVILNYFFLSELSRTHRMFIDGQFQSICTTLGRSHLRLQPSGCKCSWQDPSLDRSHSPRTRSGNDI